MSGQIQRAPSIPVLGRPEIRKLFREKRHVGVIAAIARSLDPPVTPTAVSLWLKGTSKSARIAAAAQAKAIELLREGA